MFDAYKWPPEYQEIAKEMIRKHVEQLIKNRPPDLPTAKPNEAPGPAPAVEKPKPADMKEEIRAANREWIDPRHGGARGVNEQGFAEKILPRPAEKDLVNVRGSAAEESIRSNSGFAEARSAYMRLKNKVRILNERGIPIGSGLTPFELEDWNTFNSPDLLTPSGLSIYDPAAAEGSKARLDVPQKKPEPPTQPAKDKPNLVQGQQLPMKPIDEERADREAAFRDLEKSIRAGVHQIVLGEDGKVYITKRGSPELREPIEGLGWTPPADLMPKRTLVPRK